MAASPGSWHGDRRHSALLLGGRTRHRLLLQRPERRMDDVNVLHGTRCRPGSSHSMRGASPMSRSARSGPAVCPRRSTAPSPTTLPWRPSTGPSAEPSRTRSPAGSRSQPASTGRLSRTRLRHRPHLRNSQRRRRGQGLGQMQFADGLAISVSPPDFLGHTGMAPSPRTRWGLLRTDRALASSSLISTSGWASAARDRPGDGGSRFGTVTARAHTPARPVRQAHQEGRDQDRDQCGTRRLTAGRWVLARGPKRLPQPQARRGAGSKPRRWRPLPVRRPGGYRVVGYATRTQIFHGQPAAGRRLSGQRAASLHRGPGTCTGASTFSLSGKNGENRLRLEARQLLSLCTDVPVFFLGAPFAAGYFGETEMVDLAATLARLLNINQAAACEGHPIGEILPAPTAGPGVSTSAPRLRRHNKLRFGRVVPIRFREPITARRVLVSDAPKASSLAGRRWPSWARPAASQPPPSPPRPRRSRRASTQ